MVVAKDPKRMKKDPKPPRKMGEGKFFQHPFRRRISNALGTTELPVGEQVPDRIRPAGSVYRSGNLDSEFKAGGKVRGCGMARGGAVRPCKIVKMKGS